MHPIPKMVMPSDKRPVWRNGIVQLMIGRACNESCTSCTQGSQLAGRPAMMTVEQFGRAVDSMVGYPGVLGVFGGNPALHPQFDKISEVMRAKVPFAQRGIWCNDPRGKAKIMRVTYNPAHSNLNVHLNKDAYDEFARDWPEARPYLKGLDQDSAHTAPFVAIKDVVEDESKMWDMIKDCDVNKFWSACIGVVGNDIKAYFCELAYAQAALHATATDADDWPVSGLAVEPGWWKLPQQDFEAQIRQHCPSCGIPLRRAPQLALGGDHEEFSETHRAIARPKTKGREVQVVGIGGAMMERPDRPATEYLPGTTPKVRA